MKEIEIEWCPNKEMVADFMTKPLQGSHFRRLRDLIMGMTKVGKSGKNIFFMFFSVVTRVTFLCGGTSGTPNLAT